MNPEIASGVPSTCSPAEKIVRPFLKWVGGKTQLLPELRRRLPATFGKYWEPFLGGGSLFWSLGLRADRPAEISDLNEELIAAYKGVRDHVEQTIDALQTIFERGHETDPKGFYYHIRAVPWRSLGTIGATARTIYLNKAGFNGLYRVNAKGEFNVSWGKRPTFKADVDGLRACSRGLQHVTISHGDYDIVTAAAEGDVVYLDPPYVPVRADSFTAYTSTGFGPQQQARLRDLALDLKRRGVFVMLSNSIAARDLYADPAFTVEVVRARRAVNSKGSGRGAVEEIVVT